MCLCICGPPIIEISPTDASHLSDTFDGLSPPVIMSNVNKFGSFTLGGGGGGGGDLPHLATPNTRIFIFISFKTVRLILDVVPCYRAHHQTPNILSINHVPTTYYRTPNTVSISTMHLHPCHVMSWCIMQCNHAIAYP